MSLARRVAVVLGVLAVLAAVATTAYAAAPRAASPTINGCVNKQTGVLRVVDPRRGCITRPGPLQENPISWNQAGPAGPAGPPGPAAPAVPAAPAGPAGGGVRVERRTATGTVEGQESVTIRASCEADETVVTGSSTVDGRPLNGDTDSGVFYSLGGTGEIDNGYQASVSRPGRPFPIGAPAPPAPTEPATVTVTAVCLQLG